MKLFLVGYMACGKSSLGRKLTQKLGWQLYDTDHMIVDNEGQSVAELFDTQGEEYFRGCELKVITDLISKSEDCIISTGGGAPTWRNNMELMNSSGLTIYISRTAEGIASRLSPHGIEKRPKLRGLSGQALVDVIKAGIAERDAIYSKSKLIIDADHYSDEQLIDIILSYIENNG